MIFNTQFIKWNPFYMFYFLNLVRSKSFHSGFWITKKHAETALPLDLFSNAFFTTDFVGAYLIESHSSSRKIHFQVVKTSQKSCVSIISWNHQICSFIADEKHERWKYPNKICFPLPFPTWFFSLFQLWWVFTR